jgi:uncharacterized protein YcgI (DUF1989 family)
MSDSQVVLKAREGIAVPVNAGQRIRIVNLEGGQVVDTWAINADDPDERMSMEHTRASLAKLVPQVGDTLYSSSRRPIMTLVEDTSPGVHDTLIAACDPERYRLLGASDDHASCATNFRGALAARGLQIDLVPAPLNLFMNIPWDAEGRLEFKPSPARAGDQVTLAAERDVIVVLSACPQDIVQISGDQLGDIGVAVLDGRAG